MNAPPTRKPSVQNKLGLLLLALTLAAFCTIALLVLTPRDAHIVPEADAAPSGPPRVVFAHEQLGAYHSVGPTHQPAWDISTDPVLVKNYGGANGGVLMVRCDCGLVIRMLGHTVTPDGTVTPSIWHDVPECGWHIWGQFTDWDRGEWRTAEP